MSMSNLILMGYYPKMAPATVNRRARARGRLGPELTQQKRHKSLAAGGTNDLDDKAALYTTQYLIFEDWEIIASIPGWDTDTDDVLHQVERKGRDGLDERLDGNAKQEHPAHQMHKYIVFEATRLTGEGQDLGPHRVAQWVDVRIQLQQYMN
ncbi:hypothetical protein BJY00DRAFT_288384 [Aspergillus carlsbadensis]|nr:hypothetical protein BJY00DRAFT_288384 [Aspergillus carlsbadensis]